MVNRIRPIGPVGAYKTYGVSAPRATHTRAATCATAGCEAYSRGWRTLVDPGTDLGARQVYYIERQSGRRFVRTPLSSGLVEYTFEAGQMCFAEHRISLEREPILTVRGGDWRGATTEVRVMAGVDWLDDFGTNQERLKDQIERG